MHNKQRHAGTGIPTLLLTVAAIAAWLPAAARDHGSQPRLPPILLDTADTPYLPDFSYAGYNFGVGDLPTASGTVIRVDDYGAAADDGNDDTKAVLAALDAAHAIDNPVIVRFGPGTYRISEILRIERGHLVLQGAGSGAGGTRIHFPRPLMQVDRSDSLDELRAYIVNLNKRQREPKNNVDEFFSEYSWSGGYIWVQKPGTRPAPYLEDFDPPIEKFADVTDGKQGERTLRVLGKRIPAPGDVMQIAWINHEGPEAGIVKSLYRDDADRAGSHHWSFPRRPLVSQITRVVSAAGDSIEIADPLLHDVNPEIPAHLARWAHLTEVGIEDLRFEFPQSPYFGHHLERGYNAIYLTSVFNGWVRNVVVSNADSGILTYNSANVSIVDVTTIGERKAHYGVHMGNVHNVLAERIKVYNPVHHSLTFNTQSTKCVYKDAEVFSNPVLDQHAGANHQNLFDNVTLHISASASDEGPVATVFDGSGARYWQPGHGAFNTTWNLNVQIIGGAYPDERVTLLGLDEGPMARIVGLHGNRRFRLDYRPQPYVASLNRAIESVPSLYEYQLSRRLLTSGTDGQD